MNRQKKIREKFAKKLKQAKAKRFPKNKKPYIAKADRVNHDSSTEVVDENDISHSENESSNH
ncbi:DUF2986 domain-containing protein [Thiomicrorhabdus lithotrophica]|uniref:DUF2986 domain-containing protein n=1 Tax=Thiomicrorhabdus lithotrophica TaxID=2949997 RepID=A0ABY8CGN6_9GAMM|nr:DUF2986 domain-containing protein [Thiomicrorhabdus lithotrophica]WEJ63613.1 DUF2986 domain-containing protein [Thiomicrorhabdus lithotrophica]